MAPAVSGTLWDPVRGRTFSATLKIEEDRIAKVIQRQKQYPRLILPGFVDAHVHIESSMLLPSEFARFAVIHGTVATVSDPHEIGNVLGRRGVEYMIENGEKVPFKFSFGAPSCVPATRFETAGAEIGLKDVETLLGREEIRYLSEMMNFPGVLNKDPAVMAKIQLAKKHGKMIDGHAPGLRGKDLERYIAAGISTDHETLTREEALEKIRLGMKILIREGSAARSFEYLGGLIQEYPNQVMLCSDDAHPHDLAQGHINEVVKRAFAQGLDKMKVLRAACVTPVKHYGLDVGLLQPGDPADFIVVDSLENLRVLQTWINGQLVAENGRALFPRVRARRLNNFQAGKKKPADFAVPVRGQRMTVIEALDGQLVTNKLEVIPKTVAGKAISDTDRDILKLAVVNRYKEAAPAMAFAKNFGLQKGALASSVGHDSHNIIAVGVTDEDLCEAVNLVIEHKGGLAIVSDQVREILPLPVAGIMAARDGASVAHQYAKLDRLAKSLGSKLRAPFMTLSFMSLLVIPTVKLSDQGLFDTEMNSFINLFG